MVPLAEHDHGGLDQLGQIVAGYVRVHAVAASLVLELKPELYALAVQRSGVRAVAQPEEALRDAVVDLGASNEGLH